MNSEWAKGGKEIELERKRGKKEWEPEENINCTQ